MVEDDPIIGRAVGRAADGVLPARLAKTGAEAIAALLDRPLPRFVLLDFRLPDMDGLQVLRHLRADPDCRSLPVIFFSSLQDRELIERTLAAGANDWIPKPDDPRSLHNTVRDLCQRWGKPLATPAPQDPAADDDPRLPAPSTSNGLATAASSSPWTMTSSSKTTTTRTTTTTTPSSTTTTTTTTSSSHTTSSAPSGSDLSSSTDETGPAPA